MPQGRQSSTCTCNMDATSRETKTQLATQRGSACVAWQMRTEFSSTSSKSWKLGIPVRQAPPLFKQNHTDYKKHVHTINTHVTLPACVVTHGNLLASCGKDFHKPACCFKLFDILRTLQGAKTNKHESLWLRIKIGLITTLTKHATKLATQGKKNYSSKVSTTQV